jgi:hypothetical protein
MRWLSVAALLLVAVGAPVRASVLGGGLVDTDCTVAFEGVTATDGESGVVCTDGDPTCDADATADGSCRFTVRVCTRLVANGCTPRDVSSIVVAGLALEPPVPEADPTCGASEAITVAIGGAVGATILARAGAALKDVDYLNLCCEAAAVPLGAVRCALAVDPAVAGCTRAVPAGFTSALEKARTLVDLAASDPARAKPALRRASKRLSRMRAIARRFTTSDPCGNALGLMASHAQTILRAARYPDRP